MTKQGRILILDDLPQWRKELVETLRNNGFQADAVDTVAQALEHLNTYLYHVLVLDIRMDGANQSNTEGISFLEELVKQGLNEATKVIILSAYGTKEQMRTAFKDYEVADFLSKDNPFNKQIFLESVQQVFSQKVNINLSLEIHWQPKSAFEKALLNLEIKGTSLKSASPVQKQMVAAELEDLLCRLFYQCESVLVHPLTPGWSGTGVLRIQPFYKNTGGARDVVIKFGEIDKLKREHHNFKQYVQPFVGGGHNTTVLDVRRTTQLGGVMYSLLGTASNRLDDFGTFYHQSDVSQIRSALDRLFRDTCGAWYANHGRLQPLDLSAEYQRLLGYTTKKLEQALARQLTSVPGKQKFYFKSLNNERAFTNPLTAMAGASLIRPTYTCITHGDFNQHNLLVDSIGNTWLIDFQRTAQGHILGDVAMLDSVVRFQLLATSEATLEERLQMEEVLYSIDRFSQLEQLADRLPTENAALIKAYATVIHLRKLARQLVSQNPNDDISEYYIALLYHAMNTLRFRDLSVRQREHALLCASLLVDRLGLGDQDEAWRDGHMNEIRSAMSNPSFHNYKRHEEALDAENAGALYNKSALQDSTQSIKTTPSAGSSIATPKPLRTDAFISYSHKDKRYLQELQVHLAHFIRMENLNIWDDNRILPSAKWREEIEKALQSTKVAVLLISANFLASDFIVNTELPLLLAAAEHEGVTILPVILSSCTFKDTELAQFQSVNNPSKPLNKMTPGQRDEVWTKAAERIREGLKTQK